MEGFEVNGTLKAPKKHPDVPNHAKWLGGEGAGSWFTIDYIDEEYCITRYSPQGKSECKGIFITPNPFEIELAYYITYLSHCKEVNVIQHKKKVKFELIKVLE